MNPLRVICIIVFGLLVHSGRFLAQTVKPPLPIEAIAGEHLVARVCGLALSPDGKLAAYAVQDGARMTEGLNGMASKPNGTYSAAWNCDLRVVDLQTEKSRSITGEIGSNWSPVWSPDGSRLAFYSDRGGAAQLWTWSPRDGKLARVSDAVVRAWDDPVRWTPDGPQIIARILPAGLSPQQSFDQSVHKMPSPAKTPGVLVYDSDPGKQQAGQMANSQAWDFDYAMGDLAAIDVATGEVRRLVRNRQIADYRLSPDGKFVTYSVFAGFDQENSQRIAYDLVTCSIPTGACNEVVSNIHLLYPGKGFSWSPDSRQLAYVADGKLTVVSADNSARHQYDAPSGETFHTQPYWGNSSSAVYFSTSQNVWRVDLPAGQTVFVAKLNPLMAYVEGNAEWFGAYKKTGPGDEFYSLLETYGGGGVCSPDGGRHILLRNSNGLTEGLVNVDTQTGESRILWQKAQAVWTDFVVSADAKRLVYEAEDVTHPNDIWTFSLDDAQPRQLTDLNPGMQGSALGTGRIVEWRTLNSAQPVVGGLLLPGNYQPGTKYPLVICVYGEGKADDLNRFGGWLCGHGLPQLLASRGYAYLVTGGPIRVGTPMMDIASSVLPAIDRLAALGIVNPERVGVIGHSDGGFEVASFLVQTTRFKAAVMVSGFVDLMSTYGFLDRGGSNYDVAILEGKWSNDPMGVKPWDNPLRYIENSPAYFLDRVETPLLIFHGMNDNAVPVYQSDEMFVGMRRLYKRVEYVKYEDEDHFMDYWSYQHKIDYYDRILDWFSRYLAQPRR